MTSSNGVYVCSLKTTRPQTIPADGKYHLVHFPFGDTGAVESYDPFGMHPVRQPDGVDATHLLDRSALIWPHTNGWGTLTALIHWKTPAPDGIFNRHRPTEYRDRFVRDPLNLATGYDSTATETRPAQDNGPLLHKTHEIFVKPHVPLALMVRHNGRKPVDLELAELKLAIHPAATPPTTASMRARPLRMRVPYTSLRLALPAPGRAATRL
ncbi:hypothetical protein ACFU0X_10115 [Streptomyces cellulosae]|uniref:Uncharacterized protein n=1 Tax=Streptomyces cellulosae TaxID=1968 RepID=A0ABW6JFA7_STRCE